MGKVRFTTEQIIRKLREAEVLHRLGARINAGGINGDNAT